MAKLILINRLCTLLEQKIMLLLAICKLFSVLVNFFCFFFFDLNSFCRWPNVLFALFVPIYQKLLYAISEAMNCLNYHLSLAQNRLKCTSEKLFYFRSTENFQHFVI